MLEPSRTGIGLAAGLDVAVASPASARQPINVDRIFAQGDTPAGGNAQVVASVVAPFTDAFNHVGFVGAFASGVRFIWYDDGIVFLSSDA